MTREQLPVGITRISTGYRVFVWIVDEHGGHNDSKRFPADASIERMKQWREDRRVDARRRRGDIPAGGGFLADADRYLAAVQAMPTYAERRRHIQLWAAAFGDRPRASITPADIRTVRDRWLTVGPKLVLEKSAPTQKACWVEKAIPLSASQVNQRLRALENLWTVLDGRHAYNPVRDVPEADPPDVTPRAIPYALVRAILAALPDRSRPNKGEPRGKESKTKARLAVIAYTGLSHGQVMRIQPEDLHLEARTLFLRPRRKGRKGRGAAGVTVPLLADAVKAFRTFAALNCWGTFSASSMRDSFKRACAALDLPPTLRPYDLRHSFGTAALRQSGDELATGVLMGHRDPRTTRRYTLGAVDARLAEAVNAIRLQPPTKGKRGGEVRGEVSPPRKARSVRTGAIRPPRNRQ